jgi:hypothetical protein
VKLKESAAKAALLTQKIIDARLALTRLRHAHPQPRLTIPASEQRLADQVTEMQVLTDDIEQAAKKVQSVKGSVKSGTQEVERLRAERAEAEKAVKAARVNEDDGRLVPLYDQYVYRDSSVFLLKLWSVDIWPRLHFINLCSTSMTLNRFQKTNCV